MAADDDDGERKKKKKRSLFDDVVDENSTANVPLSRKGICVDRVDIKTPPRLSLSNLAGNANVFSMVLRSNIEQRNKVYDGRARARMNSILVISFFLFVASTKKKKAF